MALPNYYSTPEKSLSRYQECIHKLWALEPGFQALRSLLAPEHLELLDHYIQISEELDRITVQMAYHVGVKQGRKDAV